MTGGGFGGCTVNLVVPEQVGEFTAAVSAAYTGSSGLVADFYVVRPAAGAHEVTS